MASPTHSGVLAIRFALLAVAHAQTRKARRSKMRTYPFSFPDAALLGSAPRIVVSGHEVQQRKSTIHGLPITLLMLRIKSDKSDWLRMRNDYFAHAPKIGQTQRPLGARMHTYLTTTAELNLTLEY